MKQQLVLALIGAAAMAVAACAQQAATGGGGPPFGGEADQAYAGRLWRALQDARLVGSDALRTTPYEGTHPHGAVLENVEQDVRVSGHTGVALVKSNYAGDGITPAMVANDPARYLDSVTVMYRREAGYDPDSENWFWAKYNPDGSLQSNPKGMKLAGRVGNKEAGAGCLGCHQGAPGNDFVFSHDRF